MKTLTVSSHDLKKGDLLTFRRDPRGRPRHYKVIEVLSASQVIVRRTFMQWLRDEWDVLTFGMGGS